MLRSFFSFLCLSVCVRDRFCPFLALVVILAGVFVCGLRRLAQAARGYLFERSDQLFNTLYIALTFETPFY